jgi:hypothetical protein
MTFLVTWLGSAILMPSQESYAGRCCARNPYINKLYSAAGFGKYANHFQNNSSRHRGAGSIE